MATEILTHPPQREPGLGILALFLLASLMAHLGFYASLSRAHLDTHQAPKPIDMEVVETHRPPPPVVKPPEPPKPLEKPKPPPKQHLPPPPKEPPPPPKQEPPPPPTEKPPPKPAPTPINIGLSLSSTTQAGGFAAPVGNSMMGKPAEKAADPSVSKPYAAPAAKFVPSYQLTDPPEVTAGADMRGFYPDDARKEGLEGQVVLQITIDTDGKVTKAKVIQPAGHGFDEAAMKGALSKLRFKPARLNGQPVATEITYKVTFLLD